MEDLLSVLPFGGRFDLLRVKGSTLKEAFEHSVHRYGRGTGELLQVAGMFTFFLFLVFQTIYLFCWPCLYYPDTSLRMEIKLATHPSPAS